MRKWLAAASNRRPSYLPLGRFWRFQRIECRQQGIRVDDLALTRQRHAGPRRRDPLSRNLGSERHARLQLTVGVFGGRSGGDRRRVDVVWRRRRDDEVFGDVRGWRRWRNVAIHAGAWIRFQRAPRVAAGRTWGSHARAAACGVELTDANRREQVFLQRNGHVGVGRVCVRSGTMRFVQRFRWQAVGRLGVVARRPAATVHAWQKATQLSRVLRCSHWTCCIKQNAPGPVYEVRAYRQVQEPSRPAMSHETTQRKKEKCQHHFVKLGWQKRVDVQHTLT